jgi:hypothetical protein
MFQSFFRICRFIAKPENQELTPAEEEFVVSFEGAVIGFLTAIVAFRFVGHVLRPLIHG